MIHITFPVHNEEKVLEKNIRKLIRFLKINLPSKQYKIIIADNASKDKTSEISKSLVLEFSDIIYYPILKKGKGIATVSSWQKYPVDINIFMDIDLSADLSALPFLIEEIKKGNDIAVGSRRHKKSKIKRSLKRRFISYCLNLILRIIFKLKIKDTACGFKAVNKKIIDEILPKIKNQTWFFDTEILILSEKNNYKIKEIPISWTEIIDEERKSAINLSSAIFDYLKEIYNLKKRLG